MESEDIFLVNIWKGIRIKFHLMDAVSILLRGTVAWTKRQDATCRH